MGTLPQQVSLAERIRYFDEEVLLVISQYEKYGDTMYLSERLGVDRVTFWNFKATLRQKEFPKQWTYISEIFRLSGKSNEEIDATWETYDALRKQVQFARRETTHRMKAIRTLTRSS